MNFGLIHYDLDPNPLAHYGKGEKLAEAGWVAHAFLQCSGPEYRAGKVFGEGRDDIYVTSVVRGEDSTTMDERRVYFAETGFTIYGKTAPILKEAVDAVLALPQRTVEFVVRTPDQAKTASQLARGTNHRLMSLRYDDDFPDVHHWVMSIEECVEAVHAKLAAG